MNNQEINRAIKCSNSQIFTPESIAKLMVKLSLKEHKKHILDPCCGNGIFLLKIIEVLKENRREMKNPHQKSFISPEKLPQLFGIDIDPECVHKTKMNLKKMEELVLGTEQVFQGDFFELFERELTGKKFELIIGNPPYIRQEFIPNKKRLRDLMAKYSQKQICYQSFSADLYSYFIEYSTYLLKEHGNLTFITPDKWLHVKYGKNLKKFILKNYTINAIITSDLNLFENALVDNVIILLKKEPETRKRKQNLCMFIRIKQKVNYNRLEKIIKNRLEYSNRNIEAIQIPQEALNPNSKWTYYLRAPKYYEELKRNQLMITFMENDFVNINRGITTGADNFFYFNKKDLEETNLEEDFLLPAIKSPRSYSSIEINSTTKSILAISKECSREELPKNVQKYIILGEKEGYHQRPTLLKRDPWFSLNINPPAPILVPRFTRTGRTMVFWNRIKAIPNQTFYEIHLKDQSHQLFVLAYLNSLLGSLAFEIEGRIEGRGLLQLAVYELGNIPLIDPRKICQKKIKNIEKQFLELIPQINTKNEPEHRELLDQAFLEILDLPNKTFEEIKMDYSRIYQRRLNKLHTTNSIIR
ncbi:MAG: N-6 DNA methylase [Candidatus Heimdallarchaeota archaeon]|nr:N-6 DNA methylase [Candidatus Heimdallarchaeota archaeon]